MLKQYILESFQREIVEVSVVIPCYRCADTIRRAVESVWIQTLLPKEIILVDDCSGDKQLTINALIEIEKEYPDGWIRNIFLSSNQGPGHARNIGWEVSSGKYIAFLDADDAWHPQKIEIQYSYMQRKPNVALCGHWDCVFPGTYKLLNSDGFSVRNICLKDMLFKNRILTRTVMLQRNLPNRFDDNMYYGEDYLLWCSILADKCKCDILEVELAYIYDDERETLSSNLKKARGGELVVFKSLHDTKLINSLQYNFYLSFSYMKYIRRIIIQMVKFK